VIHAKYTNTYFPLVSRTQYNRYRSGGGVGRCWRQGGGRDPKEEDVADEPPHQAGRKRRSEGCRWREAEETMAASWTVGFLAPMAGDRDGGGGRMAAAVLPILVAVGCERYCFKFGRC
jgi:hypothetical protein